MPQELSVSYQAVKTKVHRLMDAVVEGAKTEGDIAECIARWWTLVQPADRAVAKKYLQTVLERSNATLKAIATTLPDLEGFESRDVSPANLAEVPSHTTTSPANRI
jgi:ATP-dependent DNA ligase